MAKCWLKLFFPLWSQTLYLWRINSSEIMYRLQGWCIELSVFQAGFWGWKCFFTTLVSYEKLESLQEFNKHCFLPYTAENQWTKLLSPIL